MNDSTEPGEAGTSAGTGGGTETGGKPSRRALLKAGVVGAATVGTQGGRPRRRRFRTTGSGRGGERA